MLRDARAVRALLAAVALVLVVTYSLAGLGGVLVALTAITVGSVLAAPVAVPAAPALRGRHRAPVPMANAPFRSYCQVAEQLSWASVSPRHYDMACRPLLQQLMTSRLAERHGIDVSRSPGSARSLLGEDVWPWLDPARPASDSSQPPGVDAARMRLIVDRLEAL